MIRTILAATLFATTAYAEAEKPDVDPSQNLAFCGSQVATLAWFYQGVVNDGSPELQPELDGLLAMQSIFIGQVEEDGEETIDLFKKMTKSSVNDLVEQMQGTQNEGALALAHVNTNVRGCADIYFEKIDEDEPEAKPE
jgi:hypothetical protein